MRVNLNIKDLIAKTAFEQPSIVQASSGTSCLRCAASIGGMSALRLNNGKFVCRTCLEEIQCIKYPEKYQRLEEKFLLESESHRFAQIASQDSLPETKSQKQNQENSTTFTLAAGICVGASIIILPFLPGLLLLLIPVAFFCFWTAHKSKKQADLDAESIRQKMEVWLSKNPRPTEPTLFTFYDPRAELTGNDKKILSILDYCHT